MELIERPSAEKSDDTRGSVDRTANHRVGIRVAGAHLEEEVPHTVKVYRIIEIYTEGNAPEVSRVKIKVRWWRVSWPMFAILEKSESE